MTMISELVYVVRVKTEASTRAEMESASALLEQKLGWWPKRLSGLRVISTSVERKP